MQGAECVGMERPGEKVGTELIVTTIGRSRRRAQRTRFATELRLDGVLKVRVYVSASLYPDSRIRRPCRARPYAFRHPGCGEPSPKPSPIPTVPPPRESDAL